ncbi:hypothetical protein PB1_16904 [Bacillus methanolicus PB1]|uniref:YmcC n=1 Tax=Bacillus methanolicus PB1 TaxID=997296 RepID=I3DYD5_BACMT|nr:hypothetical protein [Bacillus methanolicus]EIJ79256.1 hypothetical protein PB1_16904 [Bacillus methanolicus PB1]
MIGWLIIACEIGFWILIFTGLYLRYALKLKRIGAFFLWCTPLIDLILIIATMIDLKHGENANFFHGLAAYYIGMTAAFGKRLMKWADERFVNKNSTSSKPIQKEKYGIEHAKIQRQSWYRHLLGWGIGNALLIGFIVFVGDPDRTKELYNVMKLWFFVLFIDFSISFSYTIFPKEETGSRKKYRNIW